jgi:hypothetical protein
VGLSGKGGGEDQRGIPLFLSAGDSFCHTRGENKRGTDPESEADPGKKGISDRNFRGRKNLRSEKLLKIQRFQGINLLLKYKVC